MILNSHIFIRLRKEKGSNGIYEVFPSTLLKIESFLIIQTKNLMEFSRKVDQILFKCNKNLRERSLIS